MTLLTLVLVALLVGLGVLLGLSFLPPPPLPSFPTIAYRILMQLPRKRAASKSVTVPAISIKAPPMRLDAKAHSAYTFFCRFIGEGQEGSFLLDEASQPTYLEVLCLPLQGAILSHPRFPIRGLGIIHIRNVITLLRPVKQDLPISFSSSVKGQRWVDGVGIEVDVLLVAVQGGETKPFWTCTATLLSRGGGKGSGKKAPQGAAAEAPVTTGVKTYEASWDLPQKTGVEYAKISGDWNPHHLYPLTAKPFGFPGPIAHGMYTLARSFADVAKSGLWTVEYPYRITAEFKRPLILPGKAQVKVQTLPSTPAAEGALVGLTPPAEEVRQGKAVSWGVFSPSGVPHMKAYVATLAKEQQ